MESYVLNLCLHLVCHGDRSGDQYMEYEIVNAWNMKYGIWNMKYRSGNTEVNMDCKIQKRIWNVQYEMCCNVSYEMDMEYRI